MDEEPCFFCRETFGAVEIQPGLRKLQEFRGYTVDMRLRQFRKLEIGKLPEFFSFESPKGQEFLTQMHTKMLQLHGAIK